ncbi:hypothetical protein BD410DRAFT_774042 [Rickenella mellea]|uniref:Exocyst complex component EXO84 n=1 Tax=Rickenella mellea TaxID=50990 RepID=A0A4Y7PW94_9AGAM|nr:hypothetical protein BD410DRAFT_774042 [Rickenella mellea]
MQSLRTRRPDNSPSKPSKQPQKLAKSPAKSPSPRKSRVDDRIKKRMSMRYADISAPTDVSVPALPSMPMPIGVRGNSKDEEVVKEREVVKEDPRAVDIRILDKETFDPDAYIKVKLANSTEAEIKSLQSSLRDAKDATAVDLQQNVFKNYAEFMMISKEISTLENDMLELKESLSEWKSMPSLLHIDDSASVADRKRNQRSSVADLRVLYANQMQTLHAQIEGSSKFVPTTPGRHIVSEMEGISVLNPATFKVEHSVKFVVLDDAVLVARRRQRRTADRPKLVAEKCWPLNDILVLDTKDTATLTNVFKIRHGKETHVYRTDISSDKKALLSQFRQAAEELSAKKRKEREGEHERRKSLWVGGGSDRRSFAFDSDAMPSVPDWMKEFAPGGGGGGAKEKAEKDAIWVGELTDQLTVAIALRQWEEACTLVAEAEAKVSTTPLLAPKLSILTSSLIASLLHALADPTNRKSTIVELTGLLVRLNAGAAARTTFLSTRSATIRKRIRMIRFEGHIQMYITDLAIVVFTGIKHTADWFLASFRENESTSCFVEWAKVQIENYAEMFRNQVFSSDVEQSTIDECIDITHTQSRKLLQEYGLDFRFLFDALLVPEPKKTLAPKFNLHTKSSVDTVKELSTSTPMKASAPAPAPAPTAPAPSPGLAPSSPDSPLSPGLATPRPLRRNPALPPRSSNRPLSATGVRPTAPVAVPSREGMM